MQGLVACHEPPATEVGRSIFARGGNVADAAIATAYAQLVVSPFASGLSGKASIHVRDASTDTAVILDAGHIIGSKAHARVFEQAYLERLEGVGAFHVKDSINAIGYQSIMTPGFVPATQKLYERYGSGKLSWHDLIAPAAELASEGFCIYPKIADHWQAGHIVFTPTRLNLRQKLELGNGAAYDTFFKPGDRGYKNGEWFMQTDHGETLWRIAREGPEVFYRGNIAEQVAEDFDANGAFVTFEDMANYQVEDKEPLELSYCNYRITSNAPPGNGMILLIMFNILEGYDLSAMGHNSPDYVETLAKAMQAAFADRARYRGDPKLHDVPVEKLLAPSHGADWRDGLAKGELPQLQRRAPGEDTTHLTVMDDVGNIVTMTHSIGGIAGAAVMTPGLGFLHNSHMNLFDPVPGSVDSIVPGKRQGGSVPTIVYQDGEPIMAIGAAQGTRQVTSTLQSVLNVLEHNMPVHQAVAATRIHSEVSDLILAEAGLPEGCNQELRRRGYRVEPPLDHLGRASAVARDPQTGELSGGSEVRNNYGRGNVGYFESGY